MPQNFHLLYGPLLVGFGTLLLGVGAWLQTSADDGSAGGRGSNRIVSGGILVGCGVLVAALGVWLLATGFRKRAAASALTASPSAPSRPAELGQWGASTQDVASAERYRRLAKNGHAFREYATDLKRARRAREAVVAISMLQELARGALAGYDTGLPPDALGLVSDAAGACIETAGESIKDPMLAVWASSHASTGGPGGKLFGSRPPPTLAAGQAALLQAHAEAKVVNELWSSEVEREFTALVGMLEQVSAMPAHGYRSGMFTA